MKKMSEIIDLVKSGGEPTYDELRYTVCVMDALMVLDGNAFSQLCVGEMEDKPRRLVYSAEHQHNERFRRIKRSWGSDPKEYLGWKYDPDNPEVQERRKGVSKLKKDVSL